MPSTGIVTRARVVFAIMMLLGFAGTPSPASAIRHTYPGPVLRLRGGILSPDQDYDPGLGWCAGGGIGLAPNRDVLLSLTYDHLYLGYRDTSGRNAALDPVELEMELGRQGGHHVTPRVAAGAGVYFRRVIYPDLRPLFSEPQRRGSLGRAFGMHFGAGVSIPLSKRTSMDFDVRYHQTAGQDGVVIGTATAGLRFLLPGPEPDPEGYVRSRSRGTETFASAETAP